jgi:hypothetical protein
MALIISTATGTVTYNLPDGSYSYAVNALGFDTKNGYYRYQRYRKNDLMLNWQNKIPFTCLYGRHITMLLFLFRKSWLTVKPHTPLMMERATIHIPAGSYTFSISADGYNPKDTLISIPGGISNHVVNLTPVFYNIQLLVNNIAGSKISDAQVTIDGLTGQQH